MTRTVVDALRLRMWPDALDGAADARTFGVG
jgi:hypothetical protein